jgi:ABC-type glutathione transport system ATPase component
MTGGQAPHDALLRVRGLCKRYRRMGQFVSAQPAIEALRSVAFEIAPTTTVALIGESGSGKSTLGRCIAGLEQPDAGEVWFDGKCLTALSERELRRYRPQIQLVMQQAAGALNPRFTAGEIIDEPLLLQRRGDHADRKQRVLRALDEVGIAREAIDKRALEFSGGQRQRLAIARALVLKPKLLVLDEALVGLDLPIQAQILELLLEIQRERGLTYLLITHDLDVASQVGEEILVMFRGEIVEGGAYGRLSGAPCHEHTKALFRAHAALAAHV